MCVYNLESFKLLRVRNFYGRVPQGLKPPGVSPVKFSKVPGVSRAAFFLEVK